jgi:urease gamma subunit
MTMTPAEQIEAAYNQAMAVIAEYLKPGQRDAEQTLNELIAILDRDDLCDAITEELVNEQVPAVSP